LSEIISFGSQVPIPNNVSRSVALAKLESSAMTDFKPLSYLVLFGLGQFGAAVSAMVVANVLCEKNICF